MVALANSSAGAISQPTRKPGDKILLKLPQWANQARLPGTRPFIWAMVPPLVSGIAIIMPAHAGLVKDGLLLQYNPYEVAAYCYGAPSLVIPWRDLKAFAQAAGPLDR